MLRRACFLMLMAIGCGSGEPSSALPIDTRAEMPSAVQPLAPTVVAAADPHPTIGATCGRLVMCADFNAGRPRPTVENARECIDQWIGPCEEALAYGDPASPEHAMNSTLVCERRVTRDVLTSVPGIARRLRLEGEHPLDVEEWADEDTSSHARTARDAFARCFAEAR